MLAHRLARLHRDAEGRVRLWPMTITRWFGVEPELATCEARWPSWVRKRELRSHPTVPGEHCSCGWYSVPLGQDTGFEATSGIDLLVELDGRIVEHERGFRAQRQRVLEARLGPCSCGAEGAALLEWRSATAAPIVPVCRTHARWRARPGRRRRSPAWLADQLGVSVRRTREAPWGGGRA